MPNSELGIEEWFEMDITPSHDKCILDFRRLESMNIYCIVRWENVSAAEMRNLKRKSEMY